MKTFLTALFFLFVLYLTVPYLNRSIMDADENIYVKVTQEMFQNKTFLKSTLLESPYYNKLPFRMWLSFPFLKVFGDTNFSHRLPEILIAISLLGLIIFFATRLTNNFYIGLLSSFFVIASKEYLKKIRQINMDNLLLLLTVLVMYFLWDWYNHFKKKSKTSYPAWKIILASTFLFFAFFTKTVSAFMPCIVFFVFLIFSKDLLSFIKLNFKNILLFIIGFFTIFSLFAFQYIMKLDAFGIFQTLFGDELYKRATIGYHHIGDWFYYFKIILKGNFVSKSFLLIFSLLYAMYNIFWKKSLRDLFLLVWAFVPVCLMSFSKSHLSRYIFFSIPAFSIMGAIFIFNLGKFCFFNYKNISKKILVEKIFCLMFFIFLFYEQFSRLGYFLNVQEIYPNSYDAFIDNVIKKNENGNKKITVGIIDRSSIGGEEQILKFGSIRGDQYYFDKIKDYVSYISKSDLLNVIKENKFNFYILPKSFLDENAMLIRPIYIFILKERSYTKEILVIASFKKENNFYPLIPNMEEESLLKKGLVNIQDKKETSLNFNISENYKNFEFFPVLIKVGNKTNRCHYYTFCVNDFCEKEYVDNEKTLIYNIRSEDVKGEKLKIYVKNNNFHGMSDEGVFITKITIGIPNNILLKQKFFSRIEKKIRFGRWNHG